MSSHNENRQRLTRNILPSKPKISSTKPIINLSTTNMAHLPDPSLIPNPLRPFDTTRLAIRAVRLPEDRPVFVALNDDHTGYINSSGPNITLPGPADVTRYSEHVANEVLVGAILWLKEAPSRTSDQATLDALQGIPSQPSNTPIRSEYGIAVGEIHLERARPGNAHHRNTSIGLTILPAYQGQGYGREAIEWALDYAFRRAGMHRVGIGAFGWNSGALRLYEKIGFKIEGRARQALWHEGTWWDLIELGMLEGEWWESRRKREAKASQEAEEGRRTNRAIRIDTSED